MNNQLILVGYVSQAPEAVAFANSGNKVVKFSIAVKEFQNEKESTIFIDVDAWNGIGERVLKTITKGRQVVLSGRLGLNTYTREISGVKVQVQKPVMKLLSFHLCGRKPEASDDAAGEQEME